MVVKRESGVVEVTSTIGEEVRAFIPHPLPPEPPLQLTMGDYDLMEKANRALGRLDGLAIQLPETALFIYLYVRKEAVLSSQIEGTQSSLSDLLLYESDEAPGVPLDDVQEVSNYVAAMEHGLKRLDEGLPLCLRLVKEMHEVLLTKGRGNTKQPGEFRTSQNWIGGTRPGNAHFVPPPPGEVMNCMGALEKFWHDQPTRMPTLIKAALTHVQFETIHPFLDGNGRLGRLLITLLLCTEGALSEPILYLSLYFKSHRQVYYEHLQRVRTNGDWEGWLQFFLEGVIFTAEQAVKAARSVLQLFAEDREKIEELGRAASSAIRVHEVMQRKPILSIAFAAGQTGLTHPTVTKALQNLEKLGVIRELTGRQRDRLFVYSDYVQLLNEGTQPL
jgi:Fic family protein